MVAETSSQMRMFKPRGALVFFAFTAFFYMALWMTFYFIMIQRH